MKKGVTASGLLGPLCSLAERHRSGDVVPPRADEVSARTRTHQLLHALRHVALAEQNTKELSNHEVYYTDHVTRRDAFWEHL